MAVNSADLIERVAANTLRRDLEGETWKQGIVIDGLLATGREPFIAASKRLVDRSIETQTSDGALSLGALDPPDRSHEPSWRYGGSGHHPTVIAPPAIGVGVLWWYRRTNEDRYLEAAKRQYEQVRSAERTPDGALFQDRGTTKVNLDTLYMVCPFLTTYASVTGDEDALADAVVQLDQQTQRLQDPETGLYRHAWNAEPNAFSQSTLWGRGNGWALGALIRTIDGMPEDHPDRGRLIDRFTQLSRALVPFQDRSGFWRNVLDDPRSALETSSTLLFVSGFARGVELGILPSDPFEEATRRGMDACRGVVTDSGSVRRVALAPGGPGAPLGDGLHGQGLFLTAASLYQ